MDREKTASKLHDAIEAEADPDLMPLLLRELPRLEALFKQCPQNHPEHGNLIRNLTAMYGQLNILLATACKEMGYPLRQWEWKDSEPLTEVARVYPMVASTNWYQWQLGAVMMPPTKPDHPWWDLRSRVFADAARRSILAEREV